MSTQEYDIPDMRARVTRCPEPLLARLLALQNTPSRAPGEPLPETIPEGQRNDWVFRRAAGLRSQGYEAAEIRAMLDVVGRRCTPPLTPAELDKITESACRYAPGSLVEGTVDPGAYGWDQFCPPDPGGNGHESQAPPQGDPGPEDASPSDASEVLSQFNRSYAVSLVGTSVAVLTEGPDPLTLEPKTDFLDMTSFHQLWAHRRLTRRNPITGRLQLVSWAQYWWEHPGRRQFSRCLFLPGQDAPPGTYNLWRGWPVQASPGDCSLYWAHVRDVICAGNLEHYRYVRRWMAHAVQKPLERPGTALVVVGVQGSGKGMWCDHFGALFGPHFQPVYNLDQVVGRFNGHLESTLLLYANEAIWGGSKAKEGALKGLITDPYLAVERKGLDLYRARNLVRLIATSNEDWAVPQGIGDRRFLFLRCSSAVARDEQYFGALVAQMRQGGLAALMHDLLHEDLDGWSPRVLPRSTEASHNKLRSADGILQWWYQHLAEGISGPSWTEDPVDGWHREPCKRLLHEHYCDWMRRHQAGVRPMAAAAWGQKMGELLPGGGRTKRLQRTVRRQQDIGSRMETERTRVFLLPSLGQCRERLEQILEGGPEIWTETVDLDLSEDEEADF